MPLHPVRITRRETSSIEQIRADIDAYFINARFDVMAEERRARRRAHVSLVMGDVAIEQYETVGGELSGIGGGAHHVGFVSKGAVLLKRPGSEVLQVPGGGASLEGPGRSFRMSTTPGSVARMLVLSPAALERAGRALLGDGFKLKEDVSCEARNAAGRALVRTTSAIFQELSLLEKVGMSHLAARTYAELLSGLAIASMHPELLEEGGGQGASSKAVAWAEGIIRARAGEPLTIGEVAEQVGVTVRALHAGFRRELGATPMQVLLRSRLQLARACLMDPAFAGDVAQVAMTSGFVNVSNFTRRYLALFGELPCEALSRARRL